MVTRARRARPTRRNDASPRVGDATWALFDLPSQDALFYTLRAVPSLRPELDDILDRLGRAGAVPPYQFQGVGMTGFVACDARGRGFKVARSMAPSLVQMLADESAWLRVAGQEPSIRAHVARIAHWHAALGVIERECVREKSRDLRRLYHESDKLYALHKRIEAAMLPYGWTAPEFKENSYVFTRDRGPVLVDAGFVHRTGSRLAHAVARAHRDPAVGRDARAFARGTLRLEYDRTIPRAVGARLHDRLATFANGGPPRKPAAAPRKPADVPPTARPWTPEAQARGEVRVGDWIVVARTHTGFYRPAVSRYLAQPVAMDGNGRLRDARRVIPLHPDDSADLGLSDGDVAWTWTPPAPVVRFVADGPRVEAVFQGRRILVELFDDVIEGDSTTPTLYFSDPVASAAFFAARLDGEAQGTLPVHALTEPPHSSRGAPPASPRAPRRSAPAQGTLSFDVPPAPKRPRTYPNHAFARRTGESGDATLLRPASLSDDHWQSPTVRAAARFAGYTTQHGYTLPGGRYGHAEKLGQGHFGVAYRVDTEVGPRLVKVPAAFDSHGRAWTRERQTDEARHEAGVAHELAAAAVTVVPHTVYTEFGGGTPAVVREYGEPVTALTGPEYAALEAELVRVERDLGWGVHDDLQLYRRTDGTVYVGDVGFWTAPPLGRARPWKPRDTGLDHKLQEVQQQFVPGLALRPDAAKYTTPWRARVPVPTLPRLLAAAHQILQDRPAGKTPKTEAWLQKLRREEAQRFLDGLDARARLGLPLPEDDDIHVARATAHALLREADPLDPLDPGDLDS